MNLRSTVNNRLALRTRKHKISIILGDFNAKAGQAAVQPYVGKYGLGEHNEQGKQTD